MNPNSALYWFAQVKHALPDFVPKTIIVPYEHTKAAACLEANGIGTENPIPWGELEDAIKALGGEAFLRTDQGSAKHDGPFAYRVRPGKSLRDAVWALVEDQEGKFWLEPNAIPQAFLVREWLDLPAKFSAFGGRQTTDWDSNRVITSKHPIAREYRVFANAERAVCIHEYWPEEAFEAELSLPLTWRDMLRETYSDTRPEEIEFMKAMAVTAAKACAAYPAWSVDFAFDRNNRIWMIDAATADRSWHPEGCPEGDARW